MSKIGKKNPLEKNQSHKYHTSKFFSDIYESGINSLLLLIYFY
jgi:hypothetical protein